VECNLREIENYRAAEFELLNHGATVRYVHAWKDERGWHFTNRGEPLWFEDTRYYSKRAIADRLGFAILEEMVSKIGIDLTMLLSAKLSDASAVTT